MKKFTGLKEENVKNPGAGLGWKLAKQNSAERSSLCDPQPRGEEGSSLQGKTLLSLLPLADSQGMCPEKNSSQLKLYCITFSLFICWAGCAPTLPDIHLMYRSAVLSWPPTPLWVYQRT